MANFCIMRIKKLHTNANVGGAVAHHLRTRETDNADPEKIKKDWFFPEQDFSGNGKYDQEKNADLELRKKAQQRAMARYKKLLPEKIRKNAVRAVELLATFSPEVMGRKDFISGNYLNAFKHWVYDKFGKENVFFMAIHKDETTPHISILLTPKDENGKLNARKFFGGRDKMRALQDDFYENVGSKFGLERGLRGSKAKHQSIQKYYQKLNERNEGIDGVINAVASAIPKKSFMQKDEDYQADVRTAVKEELEPLKTLLKESVDIDTKKEELRKERLRLNQREQNLNNEVAKEVGDVNNLIAGKVTDLKSKLTEQIENDYVPKSMSFTKGEKTIDFNKMSYSQLAEQLASFYLDDEATVRERKKEIERNFEKSKTLTH